MNDRPHDEHPHELISAGIDAALTIEERARLRSHLAGCETCRVLAADLERLVEALGREEVPPVPDALAARIAGIVRADDRGPEAFGSEATRRAEPRRAAAAPSKGRLRAGRSPLSRFLPSPWVMTAGAGLAAVGILAVVLIRNGPPAGQGGFVGGAAGPADLERAPVAASGARSNEASPPETIPPSGPPPEARDDRSAFLDAIPSAGEAKKQGAAPGFLRPVKAGDKDAAANGFRSLDQPGTQRKHEAGSPAEEAQGLRPAAGAETPAGRGAVGSESRAKTDEIGRDAKNAPVPEGAEAERYAPAPPAVREDALRQGLVPPAAKPSPEAAASGSPAGSAAAPGRTTGDGSGGSPPPAGVPGAVLAGAMREGAAPTLASRTTTLVLGDATSADAGASGSAAGGGGKESIQLAPRDRAEPGVRAKSQEGAGAPPPAYPQLARLQAAGSRITLDLPGASPRRLFEAIEQRSGLSIEIVGDLPRELRMSIHVENLTVAETLARVGLAYGLDYQVPGPTRLLVLRRAAADEAPPLK